MRGKIIGAVLGTVLLNVSAVQAADYLPPKGETWATHTPAQEGMGVGDDSISDDSVTTQSVMTQSAGGGGGSAASQ